MLEDAFRQAGFRKVGSQAVPAPEDVVQEAWLRLLTTGDVADDAALADSVSLAMLVVLETLSPLERAAFVCGRCSRSRTPT